MSSALLQFLTFQPIKVYGVPIKVYRAVTSNREPVHL